MQDDLLNVANIALGQRSMQAELLFDSLNISGVELSPLLCRSDHGEHWVSRHQLKPGESQNRHED